MAHGVPPGKGSGVRSHRKGKGLVSQGSQPNPHGSRWQRGTGEGARRTKTLRPGDGGRLCPVAPEMLPPPRALPVPSWGTLALFLSHPPGFPPSVSALCDFAVAGTTVLMCFRKMNRPENGFYRQVCAPWFRRSSEMSQVAANSPGRGEHFTQPFANSRYLKEKKKKIRFTTWWWLQRRLRASPGASALCPRILQHPHGSGWL